MGRQGEGETRRRCDTRRADRKMPKAFTASPHPRVSQSPRLDLSGRDSSQQNGDCVGAWSSKRRDGLTPRPKNVSKVQSPMSKVLPPNRLLNLDRWTLDSNVPTPISMPTFNEQTLDLGQEMIGIFLNQIVTGIPENCDEVAK